MILAAGGCVREELRSGGLAEGEGWLTLQFGSSDNVEIQTRATLGHASENRVLNAYLFLFDKDGNKVYGKWFSTLEMVGSEEAVRNADEDCWYVSNATGDSGKTEGSIKIKAPASSGFKLYLLTNLDADMVRVSSDVLAHNIDSEADLKKFPVYLNQETVSRNGYFPMSGMLSNIDIADGGSTSGGELYLTRLDAKVRFIFKAGTRVDERGQTIKSFTAKQWRVINVPRTSNLMDYTDRIATGNDSGVVDPQTGINEYPEHAPDFFDSPWTNFENFGTDGTSGFSFYMLENRQTPKSSTFTTYQDRSRQVKTDGGQNESTTFTFTNPTTGKQESRDMRIFQNANDFSTYVLVTGRVEMDLKNDNAGQTLAADVQYLIHLGDWTQKSSGSSWSKDQYGSIANYNICRNTSYTYTVTVNSVNNIRVEVETSQGDASDVKENQPGASGLVTIAKEEIALCDAHYASKTMTFHAKNFLDSNGKSVADELTWSVKTPYCDGMPTLGPNGEDIPDGLDYKWVRFRLNKKDASGNYYSDKRRKYTPRVFSASSKERTAEENKEDDGNPGLAGYHNDGCMDIRGLVKYIKEQADKYEKDLVYGTHNSDFDNDNGADGPKICVTAFVDEFYYEENPITGVSSPTLWKEFVNQPDRTMHILCNSQVSKDGESRATGSVITIQQKSIQTIYNTDPSITSLTSAWGLEYEDEYPGIWSFPQASGAGNTTNPNSNGLLNSVKLWELNSGNSFKAREKWSKFMDFEVDNATPQLQDTYRNLRYSCMTRNRDNNGDGKIDRDEIRWYTASINQLIGLYIGDGLVAPKSRLYNRSAEEQASTDGTKWMQHVASSTIDNNGYSTIVWAEEGIATGPSNNPQDGAGDKMTIRCVRNLGMAVDADLDEEPQDYIQKSSSADGKTTFTNTYLNPAALRYYTSRELDLHNQNAEENRLYKKFEVYSDYTPESNVNLGFVDFNKRVTEAIDKGEDNPYCPAGYRLPNQRELAIMKYHDVLTNNPYLMSRTGYSFGAIDGIGSGKVKTKYGFILTHIITLGSYNAQKARCVRDIRTD